MDGRAVKFVLQNNTEIIGRAKGLCKQTRLLNRVLSWEAGGLVWEPDPRHAELVLEDLELVPGVSKVAATPGFKPEKWGS